MLAIFWLVTAFLVILPVSCFFLLVLDGVVEIEAPFTLFAIVELAAIFIGFLASLSLLVDVAFFTFVAMLLAGTLTTLTLGVVFLIPVEALIAGLREDWAIF